MTKPLHILTVVGARPQFVKASALSRCFREHYREEVKETLLHTGQHYDYLLSQVFFDQLGLDQPAHNLEVGSSSQGRQTARILEGAEQIMLESRPDLVLVYGDTNSTLAGALAASKLNIPVVHVEAGLRSFDDQMPEELNRILTDRLSSVLCVPTTTGVKNLQAEGIVHHPNAYPNLYRPAVLLTGDVMYDNCMYFTRKAPQSLFNSLQIEPGKYFLASVHRPSNTDNPACLKSILSALNELGIRHKVPVILPAHPRTVSAIARLSKAGEFSVSGSALRIVDPVSYFDMLALQKQALLVLTDSGGVQKEAFIFGKPCVILRENTEWTELTESGCAILAGSDQDRILAAADELLINPPVLYPGVFGDGNAAQHIADYLVQTYRKNG